MAAKQSKKPVSKKGKKTQAPKSQQKHQNRTMHSASPQKRVTGHRASQHQTNLNKDRMRDNETTLPLLKPHHYFLFGRHSVTTALANKHRQAHRLLYTAKTQNLAAEIKTTRPDLRMEQVDGYEMKMISGDSPHQDIMLEVSPLPTLHLTDLLEQQDGKTGKSIILMLDQVTDPHNVGACLRSAAALGATALITQDRNSPAESGILARSASGGLETLPWIKVNNLSDALKTTKDYGYWSIGMDGGSEQTIGTINAGDKLILVMGSEGKGLRPLVAKNCDIIAQIPMSGLVESLNVSNAAAIGLYALLND